MEREWTPDHLAEEVVRSWSSGLRPRATAEMLSTYDMKALAKEIAYLVHNVAVGKTAVLLPAEYEEE